MLTPNTSVLIIFHNVLHLSDLINKQENQKVVPKSLVKSCEYTHHLANVSSTTFSICKQVQANCARLTFRA